IPTGESTTAPPYPTAGLPIDKWACTTSPGALDNNIDLLPVTLPPPGEGIVTAPCLEGLNFGPKRDCEFRLRTALGQCTPGTNVTLSCPVSRRAAPQVILAAFLIISLELTPKTKRLF